MDIIQTFSIIFGIFFLTFIIYASVRIITSDERLIAEIRKEWFKKYPIGTNLEVITWKERPYDTQWEANLHKGKKREKTSEYYIVVSPQEFFEHEDVPKYMWNYTMNMHEVILLVKNTKKNSYSTAQADIIKDIRDGKKEIRKISDVQMKILELKKRGNKDNENI